MSSVVDGFSKLSRSKEHRDKAEALLEEAAGQKTLCAVVVRCASALQHRNDKRTRETVTNLVQAALARAESLELLGQLPAAAKVLARSERKMSESHKQDMAYYLYKACQEGSVPQRRELCEGVLEEVGLEPHLQSYLGHVVSRVGVQETVATLPDLLAAVYSSKLYGKNDAVARREAEETACEIRFAEARESDNAKITVDLAKEILGQVQPEVWGNARLSSIVFEELERIASLSDMDAGIAVSACAVLVKYDSDNGRVLQSIKSCIQNLIDQKPMKLAELNTLLESVKGSPRKIGIGESLFLALTKRAGAKGAIAASDRLLAQEIFLRYCKSADLVIDITGLVIKAAASTNSSSREAEILKCVDRIWQQVLHGPVQDIARYLDFIGGFALVTNAEKESFKTYVPLLFKRLLEPETGWEPGKLSHIFTALKLGFSSFSDVEMAKDADLRKIIDRAVELLTRQPYDIEVNRLFESEAYEPGYYLRYGRLLTEIAVKTFCEDDPKKGKYLTKRAFLFALEAAALELKAASQRNLEIPAGQIQDRLEFMLGELGGMDLSSKEEQRVNQSIAMMLKAVPGLDPSLNFSS